MVQRMPQRALGRHRLCPRLLLGLLASRTARPWMRLWRFVTTATLPVCAGMVEVTSILGSGPSSADTSKTRSQGLPQTAHGLPLSRAALSSRACLPPSPRQLPSGEAAPQAFPPRRPRGGCAVRSHLHGLPAGPPPHPGLFCRCIPMAAVPPGQATQGSRTRGRPACPLLPFCVYGAQ